MIASVSAEADRELTEGALFYAKQGGSEVAIWRNGRRRFLVRKFPYSVVY